MTEDNTLSYLPEEAIGNRANILFSDIFLGILSLLGTWSSSLVTAGNSFTSCFPHFLTWIVIIPTLIKCPWHIHDPLSQCHNCRLLLSPAQPLPSISGSHFCISQYQLRNTAIPNTSEMSAINKVHFSLVLHAPQVSWSLPCTVLTQELRLKGRSPPGLVCLWRHWKECSKLLLALMWIAGNSCELLGSNLHYLWSHFIAKPDFKGNREMTFYHTSAKEKDPEYLWTPKMSATVGFQIQLKPSYSKSSNCIILGENICFVLAVWNSTVLYLTRIGDVCIKWTLTYSVHSTCHFIRTKYLNIR